MSIRVLRKALGLLIVDIVIIIGIFVLQFRTDSSIIEKIENLQFTFARADGTEDNTKIKNKLNVSYNGINFFCDDQHPAVIVNNNAQTIPVELLTWERPDELSCKLTFSDNVAVTFELASKELNASLAIISELPSGVTNFALPYSFSSNMKMQKDDGNRVILNGRKNSWEVSADTLASGYFGLSSRNYVATYGIYDETQKFTFDSIVDLEIANSSVFERNVENFRNNLITAFKNNNAESNLTEQIVVSYIAAQAENGNYVKAIEDIPSGFKKSKQRTYLSTPYLNTLEEMNATLEKTMKEYEKKINDSAYSNSLDIFTIPNIASFMFINPNAESVKKLLQSTAYVEPATISIAQATGILNVYTEMSSLNGEYAKLLTPAVTNCIERITEACSFEGNILTISDNDTFLSVIQAVETGVALLRYGILCNDSTLQKAGYVLVNSYMSESSSFDLRTLSNLYPILAYNNWYYPHFKKIGTDKGQTLWAWTCSENITWERTDDHTGSLIIDFPEGLTQYLIIKGIPQFSTIYIYNMAFRTDPRFETYNSSGYVYKQNSQTLLLKSRHKSQLETVTFDFTSAAEKKAIEAAKPKEPVITAPETTTSDVNESSDTIVPETTEVAPVAEPADAVETAPAAESETVAAPAEETPAEVQPQEEPAAAPVEEKKTTTRKKNTWGKKTE